MTIGDHGTVETDGFAPLRRDGRIEAGKLLVDCRAVLGAHVLATAPQDLLALLALVLGAAGAAAAHAIEVEAEQGQSQVDDGRAPRRFEAGVMISEGRPGTVIVLLSSADAEAMPQRAAGRSPPARSTSGACRPHARRAVVRQRPGVAPARLAVRPPCGRHHARPRARTPRGEARAVARLAGGGLGSRRGHRRHRRAHGRGAPPPPDAETPSRGRFAPPSPGPGAVARPALVRRLREASSFPLVVLRAPAGFGKTALLSQWAEADPRPVAWLTVGPEHADDGELTRDLAEALERLGPGGAERGAAPVTPLGRVRRALAGLRAPALVVIDDAHLLAQGEALAAVGMVCAGLPPGSQAAIACRAEPALRGGLLRSRGLVLTLGPEDLAMDGVEAAHLLSAAGAGLDREAADALVDLSEGWPAGIRLAAGDRDALEDYVEDEVLSGLTAPERELVVRTALLERLSTEDCDAVLGRPGSGPLLDGLARRGLLVAPGGPGGVRRHRRLVADAVGGRLARRDPELLGELVWRALPLHLATGRLDVVGGWLARRSPGEIGASPALSLAAAWCGLEGGGEAEHWIEAAAGSRRPLGGPGELAAAVALLRATAAREGVARMADDARASSAAWAHDSPWRAVCCAVEGVALDLAGDREGALARLRDAARRAGPQLPWAAMASRSWQAMMAVRDGAWERAERLCAQSEAALRREGLGDCASAAVGHSAAALLLARSGRRDEARARRARADRLLALAPDLAPWRLVAARVLLARASALLGDAEGAHGLLDGAREPLALLAGSATLHLDVAAAREAAEGLAPGARERQAPLTAAEARVLRFLPTHHSFRDIGARLHLSRFTVKSQALAVYRKLGVSSRGEAVARARVLGLLDDEPPR